MKRLSNTISQKHLRTLAIKHGMQEASSAAEKIESPLMKIDSTGNISCVICRTPLKSANIWKVHVNSKAHKNNVQVAKELKTKLLSTSTAHRNAIVDEKTKREITPTALKPSPAAENKPLEQIVRVESVNPTKSNEIVKTALHDPLPLMFFDSTAADKKDNTADNKDKEWELFQKEIKEVTEAANEIFAADQKELAVEKEIVEIDEQIQHWSKVLDLEEKRKNLHNKGIGKSKCKKMANESDEESSETEDFDEYTDWRSKVFK